MLFSAYPILFFSYWTFSFMISIRHMSLIYRGWILLWLKPWGSPLYMIVLVHFFICNTVSLFTNENVWLVKFFDYDLGHFCHFFPTTFSLFFWNWPNCTLSEGNYLLSYLATRGAELEPFVITSLIQLFCRVTKFGWLEDDRFREVVSETMNFLSQVIWLTLRIAFISITLLSFVLVCVISLSRSISFYSCSL